MPKAPEEVKTCYPSVFKWNPIPIPKEAKEDIITVKKGKGGFGN